MEEKVSNMYEAPAVEIVEVAVERGFAGSVYGEGDDITIQ